MTARISPIIRSLSDTKQSVETYTSLFGLHLRSDKADTAAYPAVAWTTRTLGERHP